jgi:hypothetical protein
MTNCLNCNDKIKGQEAFCNEDCYLQYIQKFDLEVYMEQKQSQKTITANEFVSTDKLLKAEPELPKQETPINPNPETKPSKMEQEPKGNKPDYTGNLGDIKISEWINLTKDGREYHTIQLGGKDGIRFNVFLNKELKKIAEELQNV